MDRHGFIDYNTRLSPNNSKKASSYAQAIKILDEVLVYQNVIDLHGRSLYDIPDTDTLEEVLRFVKEEKNLSMTDAMRAVYTSDTYKKLENETTKMWHLGPVALYEEFTADMEQ